jgi:hypothetical protein
VRQLRLGRQDAPRQLLPLYGNHPQDAQHVIVYHVGCAPLGFLGSESRVLACHLARHAIGVYIGMLRSQAQDPGCDTPQGHGGKRSDRLLYSKVAA